MIRRLAFVFAVLPPLMSSIELSAQEAPSGLATLLEEAAAESPRIHAAERAAEAARARVSQAGALPDPTLGVGVMNLPVADPSLGRDMMTMARIEVGERVPWPGKQGLQEDVARLLAEAAEWEVQGARHAVAAEVKAAYFDVYFLDRALEITTRNEYLLAGFARLTSAEYGVGRASQVDVLKAQVEQTRLMHQMATLRERRTSALARMNALLSRPSGTSLPSAELPEDVRAATVGRARQARFVSAALSRTADDAQTDPVLSVAELQRLAYDHSPMLQAHAKRVSAQERVTELAQKALLPDVHVSIGYSRRANFGDFMDLMISASVPIFAGRKQDQAVLEQAAVLAEAESGHHAMVNDLNAEIESLVASLRRTRQQIILITDAILPQAQAGLQAARASYGVGEVDFLTLLDAQITLFQNELDYHQLMADFARDVAELERAVGTEVLR